MKARPTIHLRTTLLSAVFSLLCLLPARTQAQSNGASDPDGAATGASVAKAAVAGIGPAITGYDWGDQWVTSAAPCTKSDVLTYAYDAVATNVGAKDYAVHKVVLVGKDADDGIFQLDSNADRQHSILPGDEIKSGDTAVHRLLQRVLFKPVAEREYSATILLITESGDTASAALHGIGTESHISVDATDLGNIQFVSPGGPALVGYVPIKAPHSTRSMTLTGATLKYGTEFGLTGIYTSSDRASRVILPHAMASGEVVLAQVRFVPQSKTPDLRIDTLFALGDFSRCDDSTAPVVAHVTVPGPFVGGYDWRIRWVINACAKNDTSAYPGDVYVINTGPKDVTIRKIVLTGPDVDAGIFSIDPSAETGHSIDPGTVIPKVDAAAQPRLQRILFKPAAEGKYSATLLMITDEGDTLRNIIRGAGIESHLSTGDYDFGTVRFIAPNNPRITATVDLVAPKSTRDVTITELRLSNTTDFSFTTDPPTIIRNDGTFPFIPFTIAYDEVIKVAVRFHPQSPIPAVKTSRIIVLGDFSRCDDSTGTLRGTIAGTSTVVSSDAGSATLHCTAEPNPFAAATTISLTLDAPSRTSVEIFDAAGVRVASLADEFLDVGGHAFRWDAGDLPSGIYYCRVRAGAGSIMRPVLLVR